MAATTELLRRLRSVVADGDIPPAPGMLEPTPDEIKSTRSAGAVDPEELDGPHDLDGLKEDATTRDRLPPVAWPASDDDAPDYAHLVPIGREPKVGSPEFDFGPEEIELLIRANRFEPAAVDDRFVFGLRGAELVGRDRFEVVDRIRLKEVRPDHKSFRCTIGFYSRAKKKLWAYKASTVPHADYMINFYKWKNNIGDYKQKGANLMPTGCYVYAKGVHAGTINPALRLAETEKLLEPGTITVLRTIKDLTYKCDDTWERCTPWNNVHCAYSFDKFYSAGCQTLCGPDGDGPWDRFQGILRSLPANGRADYILLTGREASIAAYLIAENRDRDEEAVQRYLGRLRHGSHGDAVLRLQRRLGIPETGYFGATATLAWTDYQRKNNARADGIYSAALDQRFGWDVMSAPAAAVPAPAPPPAPAAAASEPASPPVAPDAKPPAPAPTPAAAAAAPVPMPMPPIAPGSGVPGPAPIPRPEPVDQPRSPIVRSAPTPPGTAKAPSPPPAVVAGPASAPPPPTSAPPPTTTEPITNEALRRFAPRALPQYLQTFAAGRDILARYGITQTPERLCSFLGQIGNESGRLTILEENMSYTSASRLHTVWPGRFPTLASAEPYVRNPEKLAEKVYGGRLGNDRPGDGWLYRGRGLVQITGRGSYREMGKKLGIPLESDPDLACHPDHALRIACETWAMKQLPGERDMNRLADVNKLDSMTYRINGGYTNIDDRRDAFEQAWRIFAKGEPPKRVLEPEVLDRGDRNGRVDELNRKLATLGLFDGITGTAPQSVFNGSTYGALRKFQEGHGLTPTGVATPDTWERLLEAAAEPPRAPTRGGPSREPAPAPSGQATPERARQRLRVIRNWAIFLLLAAIAFVGLYAAALVTPGRYGESAQWMPMVFAGLVLIGSLVTWSWCRAIDRSDLAWSRDPGPDLPRGGPTRQPEARRGPDEEPVREGINLGD